MNVLAIVYAFFAALFFIFTFSEGQRKGLPWDAYRLLGLAMSIVWPVALLVAYLNSRGAAAELDRTDRRDER